jgi:aminoglycoside phosphotransferase family enzyme
MSRHAEDDNDGLTLEDKVAFLSRPSSYPDRPHHVRAVETHMSWVFLTDTLAYKLKKPVRYEFLDFSTRALRRADCELELTLNRRLAPGVYLRVAALTRGAAGTLGLDGAGTAVDWLVVMRRLPDDGMLDQQIRRGQVEWERLRTAAYFLAGFYRDAPPVVMSPKNYRTRLEHRLNQGIDVIGAAGTPTLRTLLAPLATVLRTYLAADPPALLSRAARGKFVEGHGDLRPEHIYLGAPPAFIDCLEFERDFRLLDPLDEISFLAMECERLHAGGVGAEFLAAYVEVCDDPPPPTLLVFYKAGWALFRCKIAVWHTRDPAVADQDRWSRLAQEYLGMAHDYCARLRVPG